MKRKGILALDGASCGSCVYTIEHLGRKIDGVVDVRVNASEQKAVVDYEGPETVLDEIVGIVNKIGHTARIVTVDE